MKLSWIIGIVTGFCLLFIIAWQIHHFQKIHLERNALETLQIKESINELLPLMRANPAIGENLQLLSEGRVPVSLFSTISQYLDEALGSKTSYQYHWALWMPDRDTALVTSSKEKPLAAWQNSTIKKCFSCFILVSFPEEIDREGMVVNHTVAEMTRLGWDKDDLIYFSMIIALEEGLALEDMFILIIMLLLGVTLAVVLIINIRQKELIRQKEDFINHLSHQFKTPLASIKLGIKMMLNDQKSDHKKMLQLVNIESNRLDKHVQTVLQWLKSDARRFEVQMKALDLNRLINEVIAQLRPLFEEHETSCQFSAHQESVIFGDEYHLSLVLFNLIENAISHNEKGVSINIGIQSTQEAVALNIQDNGHGFDVKEALSSRRSLGLHYAYKVMNSHMGELVINSEPDKGTVVKLLFSRKQ